MSEAGPSANRPTQQGIGLDTVEAEDQAELVMGEDTPAEQVDGERLADRRGKISALGPELSFNFRRQVYGNADVHRATTSSSSAGPCPCHPPVHAHAIP